LYRELQEREGRIRRLVDANIVGIFIWDLSGTILEANEAFLRMVGYQREELVSGGVRWTDLSAPQWHGRNRQELVAEIQRTGSLQPFEWEYISKDGSRVPVLVGAASFEGVNQGVAFVLDLTERKRAEEARRRVESYLTEAQRLSRTGSSHSTLVDSTTGLPSAFGFTVSSRTDAPRARRNICASYTRTIESSSSK
jgi:PAS domain S-box-containing protein